MFASNSQANFNIIQPIPRFYAVRFGRRLKIDDDTSDDHHRESKPNQVVQLPTPSPMAIVADPTILITGVRTRDWNFGDDLRSISDRSVPRMKYQLIPSMGNTMKTRATSGAVDNHGSHHEEYDLDEQDFQWLIAYNQFRIEKQLPELDENIFEYIMQLLEQQCLLGIRQRNYADTIQCDACRRIDDADDLIQCTRCQSIVHKKCYGLDGSEIEWTCQSCRHDSHPHCCCLCEKSGGIVKLLRSASPDQQWVHLACAFWLPTIEYDEEMAPVIKEIPHDESTCQICNQSRGVKINCSWKNCSMRFHAACAVEAEQDMLIAESEDKLSVRLLALCQRHTGRLDLAEKRVRMNQFFESKRRRFEQFESYVDLDAIKQQTSILPDVLESIHAYWVLKRQTNDYRPLIDAPDDLFYQEYDKNIDLVGFARQYGLDHQNTNPADGQSNMLQFLVVHMPTASPSMDNIFVKFARRHRTYFVDYERSRFCVLDAERRKRDGALQFMGSVKGYL